ncbi:MAG: phosphoribosylanthranilate isomerase [Bacteroidales bacterium]|jgi:phosphoribosylanthranilate isomerase|nr:phosphoribosylanthranilate isomerase [Bacteroidales bacterium]
MLKIKVCGMKDPSNASQISALPVDYMGFIFYSGSPRYAGLYPPARLLDCIRPGVKKTGVFVDLSVKDIMAVCERTGIDVVQLHGNEDPVSGKELKSCGYTVIKAFNPAAINDGQALSSWSEVCDFFLFDSGTGSKGGSGKRFDWSLLSEMETAIPFFLSGGIGPEHVSAILQIRNKNFYGVDINSRFEISPGIKSADLTATFIKQLTTEYYELSCK